MFGFRSCIELKLSDSQIKQLGLQLLKAGLALALS